MLDVKRIIKEKGYTVTSLAEKLEMTQVSLSRIINGNPTVDTLQKIANALEVDVKDLFNSTNGSDKIYLIVEDELHKFSSVEELKKYVDTL